jgi:Peptidase family M28
MRFLICGLMLALAANAQLTPDAQAVADRISADSLRGHLSFIASDALEGRDTPSRGLDLAAEYIAAQFRRAGLEPAGDDGYFQTATLTTRTQNYDGFEMTISAGDKSIKLDKSEVAFISGVPVDLRDAPIVAVDQKTELTAGQLQHKVVISTDGRLRPAFTEADLSLVVSTRPVRHDSQVLDLEVQRGSGRGSATVFKPELTAFLKEHPDARITVHLALPVEQVSKVRNVAGILRGSDPALKSTYVMLTAHYDHVGMGGSAPDKIFNGANDDGSGTVSVMEIAAAIAEQKIHPKRSILFMTLFGEELGMVGSRYYARHPLVPLKDTIADLNLEQVGRTDDSEGPQVGTATVTGFDFSDMTKEMVEAGKLSGIKVYKSEAHSDDYFRASDNLALAEAGVPAHTMGVAFEYPDYHGVGDEWQKIDYANMAKVDRTVAIALLHFASDAPPPQWNASNPKTKAYVEAARKLHGGPEQR